MTDKVVFRKAAEWLLDEGEFDADGFEYCWDRILKDMRIIEAERADSRQEQGND